MFVGTYILYCCLYYSSSSLYIVPSSLSCCHSFLPVFHLSVILFLSLLLSIFPSVPPFLSPSLPLSTFLLSLVPSPFLPSPSLPPPPSLQRAQSKESKVRVLPPEEKFGLRFVVKLKEFQFRLVSEMNGPSKHVIIVAPTLVATAHNASMCTAGANETLFIIHVKCIVL